MRHYSELESERIVLECRCGEMMILLGHEEDWAISDAPFVPVHLSEKGHYHAFRV
jgi:hypothetical protein